MTTVMAKQSLQPIECNSADYDMNDQHNIPFTALNYCDRFSVS